MGIHRFFNYISRHPKFRKAISSKFPSDDISSFYVDCNGIFHEAKADVYSKTKSKDKARLEKKHINTILEKLTEIVKDFKPEDLLVLAPDGGANCGKMNQQKSRRFKAVHYEGEDAIDPDLFDSNSISPGTEFMIKLDKAIRKWLVDNEEILPRKVIYSSHMNPGEGEHILVDMIRQNQADEDGVGLFYGMDGDLILLTLLAPLDKIYLCRENKNDILNITLLRKFIKEEMKFEDCDRSLLIQDFVVLVFMIGNDFLHRLPILHDTINSMEALTDNYKKTKLHLTNGIGKVAWENLLIFWKNLEDYDIGGYSLYQLHVRQPLPYPYKEYFDATIIRDLKGVETDKIFDPSKHKIDFDKKIFTKLWYEKQFKPRKKELIEKFKNDKYFEKRDIMNMCKYYLRTLEWNLEYYLGGHNAASKNLFYPFFYSPMLPSLINYLEYLIEDDKMSEIENKLENDPIQHSVVHQLMLIMPPQSKDLIPEPFRKLYLEKLQSISPSKFVTLDPEGTDREHVTTALIPPINPYLVTRVVAESGLEIPDKYKESALLVIEKEMPRKVKKHRFSYDIPQTYIL